MVNLVYLLAFLFAQGALYRLIWPEADSLVAWLGWLVATGAAASAFLFVYKRFRNKLPAERSNAGE